MHLNANVLLFSTLFATGRVVAQLSGVATSDVPDVTYIMVDYQVDSFVFCSDQGCSGTCEVTNIADAPPDDGHGAPNGMGFQSMYWYNPEDTGGLDVYTCPSSEDCPGEVLIGPNTCYDLYENGVPTYFYDFWYFVIGGKM